MHASKGALHATHAAVQAVKKADMLSGSMLCLPMQAQRRALRRFEAYLAGAPLSPADEPPAAAVAEPLPPRTPPLRVEEPSADVSPTQPAPGLQAFKKRRHSREEEAGLMAQGTLPDAPAGAVSGPGGTGAACSCAAEAALPVSCPA